MDSDAEADFAARGVGQCSETMTQHERLAAALEKVGVDAYKDQWACRKCHTAVFAPDGIYDPTCDCVDNDDPMRLHNLPLPFLELIEAGLEWATALGSLRAARFSVEWDDGEWSAEFAIMASRETDRILALGLHYGDTQVQATAAALIVLCNALAEEKG